MENDDQGENFMRLLQLWLIVLTAGLFFCQGNAFADGLTIKNSEGRVLVTVTYTNPGQRIPAFEIRLASSVINLKRYDIQALSVLRDDRGREFKGKWTPRYIRRRDSAGTLVFEGIDARDVKEIELIIRDVGRVEKRSFKWPVRIP